MVFRKLLLPTSTNESPKTNKPDTFCDCDFTSAIPYDEHSTSTSTVAVLASSHTPLFLIRIRILNNSEYWSWKIDSLLCTIYNEGLVVVVIELVLIIVHSETATTKGQANSIKYVLVCLCSRFWLLFVIVTSISLWQPEFWCVFSSIFMHLTRHNLWITIFFLKKVTTGIARTHHLLNFFDRTWRNILETYEITFCDMYVTQL